MDGTMILLALAAVVIVVFIAAMLISAAQRFAVRPNEHDVVQSSWAEHRDLRHQAINGVFWRFIAKLEFVLLMAATTYIALNIRCKWYYIGLSAVLCLLGILWLFC